MALESLKVAFVHDWLMVYGGAERLLAAMLACIPHADIYSLVENFPNEHRDQLLHKPVHTSFLQKFPFAKTKYRSFLPLMPFAIEQFDLSEYDVVISCSFAVAKGVMTSSEQLHICMCCSPIRYAWDLQNQYLAEAKMNTGLKGWLARWILHKIRLWDVASNNRVTTFLGISDFIVRRINHLYGRDATTMYPPVDVESFDLCEAKEDYYITASRCVPYKKISLIAEAFTQMPDKKLIVIGDGPEYQRIAEKAGSNVQLLGFQPNDVLRVKIRKAKAFVFAAKEDFGIAPLEAQACGTPVIAYGAGAALETIISGKTGVFFKEQTVSSLIEAVETFENQAFDPKVIRENAERFSGARFKNEFSTFVQEEWTRFNAQ